MAYAVRYGCTSTLLYIGVDFCVTRFDYMGNAKALNRGMGNWYRFPRFLFIVRCKFICP